MRCSTSLWGRNTGDHNARFVHISCAGVLNQKSLSGVLGWCSAFLQNLPRIEICSFLKMSRINVAIVYNTNALQLGR